MRRTLSMQVAALALVFSPLAVQAGGAYIGVGVGEASLDGVNTLCRDIEGLRTPGTTVNCTADDSDTSVSIFGGYEFGRHFAVELGYLDLGEVSLDTRIIEQGAAARLDASFEFSGTYVAAVGRLPVGERATLFLKAGVIDIDAESRAEATVGGLPLAAEREEESGTEALYAAGVDVNVGERMRIRFQYERIDLNEAIDNLSLALIGTF